MRPAKSGCKAVAPVRKLGPSDRSLADIITSRETSMVRISILYPNNKGSRFDFGYYIKTHMPMSIDLLSAHAGFRGVSVEHGLGGAAPGRIPGERFEW